MKFATLLVSTLIVIAILIPGRNLPDVALGDFDKLIHVAMFSVWAIAMRFDLYPKRVSWLLVFLTGLVFSGMTEILQLKVEGRSFDVYDIAADAVGLLAGLLTAGPVVRWIKKSG